MKSVRLIESLDVSLVSYFNFMFERCWLHEVSMNPFNAHCCYGWFGIISYFAPLLWLDLRSSSVRALLRNAEVAGSYPASPRFFLFFFFFLFSFFALFFIFEAYICKLRSYPASPRFFLFFFFFLFSFFALFFIFEAYICKLRLKG